MPALKLFGRKWLAATDDFVIPCVFEILWRSLILIFTIIACLRYWSFFGTLHETAEPSLQCEQLDVVLVKTYLIGTNVISLLNIPLLIILIWLSSRGTICDLRPRRHVTPLIYLKLFLLLPEIAVNVIGSLWAFSDFPSCKNADDSFANNIVIASVIVYWIKLSLIVFGIIVAYDPLGGRKYRQDASGTENNNLNEHHEFMHGKISKLWKRRFRLCFCCISKDENGDEAFLQSAELFSNIFNGTNLIPSDIVAAAILLRVRQKKEIHEQRRLPALNDICPRYSTDLSLVFNSQCPPWMTLRNAQHFLRFAISSYAWGMLCAITPYNCCKLMKRITCCAPLRNRTNHVDDDNCCNCNEAGTRVISRIHSDDVVYAQYKNDIFEVPFCLLVDRSTKSIVLTIRGSWSLSDIFTDLSAIPQEFHAEGFPDNTFAHYGSAKCCEKILDKLTQDDMLDKVFDLYPGYDFVITGHSLGAAIGILLGAKLRSKYKNLKVYGYGTPSGMLTREAARLTEQFAFTVVIGDDWVSRISLEAVENVKVGVIETLQSCRLPKYRVILNGLQYTLLGIPTRHLEKTWYNVNELSSQSNHSSVLLDPEIVSTITSVAKSMTQSRPRMYIGGKVLHIVRKKKSEMDKKNRVPSTFEMRWAQPEDFMELKIMPRMMVDHFPQNIMKCLTRILKEKDSGSTLSVDRI